MSFIANSFHFAFVCVLGLWVYYEILSYRNAEPSRFLGFTRFVALLMLAVVVMSAWTALLIPPHEWSAMQVKSFVGLGLLAIYCLGLIEPLGRTFFGWLFLTRRRQPRIPQGPLPTDPKETPTDAAHPWARGKTFTKKK
jgi:hypothetical protein